MAEPEVLLYVPIAQALPGIGARPTLPRHLLRNVTPLAGSEIGDISQIGGRAYRPQKPFVLYGPDGRMVLLAGLGEAEASELEDVAAEFAAEHPLDIDEYREQRGLPSREKAGALMAEAIWERIKRHRANWRTDPPRKPMELTAEHLMEEPLSWFQ